MFFPEVFIAGIIVMVGGVAYHVSKPPMTELQRFVAYTERDDLDLWVRWQQRGSFAGREAETDIGRKLVMFRDDLRERRLVAPEEFDAVFGAEAAPNYCAISKAVIAAGFAAYHGGSPDDYVSNVRKYSSCVP